MPLYIAKSGDLEGCHACLTDSHLKDRATQLLIKYKSGALVTQLNVSLFLVIVLKEGKKEKKFLNFLPGFPSVPVGYKANRGDRLMFR